VLSRNDEPGAAFGPTPAILQTFVVQNDAPSGLPLGELTLRYYFTSDGLGAPTARCDEGRAAPADACVDVETRVFGLSPATPFADAFVEVFLIEGAELAPGTGTREMPVTIEPPVGSLYDQSTDYSFAENSSLAANARVTLYRKGVLVWGREP
jgi:mannan endo-1,4-beta-mannosidase